MVQLLSVVGNNGIKQGRNNIARIIGRYSSINGEEDKLGNLYSNYVQTLCA